MRVSFSSPRVCFSIASLMAATLFWSGCAGNGHAAGGDPPATQSDDTENHLFDPLMKGDRIEIDLRGTPVIVQPSVQNIQQDGTITLENIPTPIRAAGLTPGQLEMEIYTNYVPAIYTHLNVHVTPTLRYFYVGGMVHNSGGQGRQTYTSAITVTRAIQAAGDFTDYADQRHVRLTRMRDGKTIVIDCKKILKNGAPDPQVAPGDQIYVPMRRL